jgi:hypothetical protein
MINDTSDPSNKPEYAKISDSKWEAVSESARQTIIESLNDRVSVRAYLRYQDAFNGYRDVREAVMEMVRTLCPDTDKPPAQLLPGFLKTLKESIDPLSRVIWKDVDNRIEELKRERRETLDRLLQKSVNRQEVSEIREDILDEIEKL